MSKGSTEYKMLNMEEKVYFFRISHSVFRIPTQKTVLIYLIFLNFCISLFKTIQSL